MGFRPTVSDPCLFWKKSRTGRIMLLFLFVDDIQAGFDKADEKEWDEHHAQLKKRFDITDLGESRHMLGMRITRDRSARTIQLDQESYVRRALAKFGLSQCKTAPTPGIQTSSIPVGDREGTAEQQPTDLKLYQEKVGTLLYAAISTRPDIAFAVNKLTQHMTAPTFADAKACDRVFRYLAGTPALGLLFGRNSQATATNISAYADSDWGSDHADRRSISGWIAMVNGDPISWASKKQRVIAQSTCEAELYAEVAAINEMKWLDGFLQEIGQRSDKNQAPVIYGDNQSAQELSKNGIKSERTKHIDIKYHFVTDEVVNNRVQLKWIPTTEQLADILTKALGPNLHKQMREKIMVEASASKNKKQ
jgi:hypothetical protein